MLLSHLLNDFPLSVCVFMCAPGMGFFSDPRLSAVSQPSECWKHYQSMPTTAVLTSFCLTPNALQLSIRLPLCLAVQSSPSCCFHAASCPCNPRICCVWEIHLVGGGGLDGHGWVGGWRAWSSYSHFHVKCTTDVLSLHIRILYTGKTVCYMTASLSFLLYLWKLPVFVPS